MPTGPEISGRRGQCPDCGRAYTVPMLAETQIALIYCAGCPNAFALPNLFIPVERPFVNSLQAARERTK